MCMVFCVDSNIVSFYQRFIFTSFVFILFLACFWFSMLLSHQNEIYFFFQIIRHKAYVKRCCWESIWLFDGSKSSFFSSFSRLSYLFCTCKIQKCHLDFSLWNRFSMFSFFFFFCFFSFFFFFFAQSLGILSVSFVFPERFRILCSSNRIRFKIMTNKFQRGVRRLFVVICCRFFCH